MLYILFTFLLIKKKHSKTEEKTQSLQRKELKKIFFLTVQSHSYW